MKAPGADEAFIFDTQDADANQWRPGEVETLFALGLQKGVDVTRLSAGGQVSDVDNVDRQRSRAVHKLMRAAAQSPLERRSQNRMAIGDAAPGFCEGLDVQIAFYFVAILHQIEAWRRPRHRMEEHAFLHWRQRIGVLYVRMFATNALQVFVIEFAQREGRRLRRRCQAIPRFQYKQAGCERAGCRVMEYLAGGQFVAACAQFADNLNRPDRIAAEVEEIIFRPDAFQIQRLCKCVAKRLFPGCPRRNIGGPRRADMSTSGSAFRSIFPVRVRGSVSSRTKNCGIM